MKRDHSTMRGIILLLLVVSILCTLSACGRESCPDLAGLQIPASHIGLSSGLATVVTTTVVPATSTMPEYCKVNGTIAPIDPAAMLINFQVNMPTTTWNSKALQYGGGGFNGSLVNGLAALRDAAPDDPHPLMRGYVTFGTDSGHQASAYAANAIAQFGLNDEMLINYAYASYKKVHDVAVILMQKFYGQSPSKMYYFGGSEGGREGLTMAQRFPEDYDGIVSVVPVVQLSMLFHSYLPINAPQFSGGWMNVNKVNTLANYVVGKCDALDGLADGVINNYMACQEHVNLSELRCAGGADTGDTCLSDAQIATVLAVHSPFVLPFSGANDITTYPQHSYGNENNPDTYNGTSLNTMSRWICGTAAPTIAIDPLTASQSWLYGANFIRYFVTKDANFDVTTFDMNQYKGRLQYLSSILDSTDPNLSRFFARGGKLIMRENMGDLAQSPLAGINYFQAVAAKVGKKIMNRSARLYISPASTHSGPAASVTTATEVPTKIDLLGPLDTWVTTGVAPADSLVMTRKATTSPYTLLASRPMCLYPNYPRYNGGGADAALASSYTCTSSHP